MKAPFPWFGGKSKAAGEVSEALGDVSTYCEPFAGSLAVLLAREPVTHEVVNDNDGFLSNFWRAVRAAPDDVARWADYPVNEIDLTARHWWLVTRAGRLKADLETDPDFYDAKAAGWWVWGICGWIGDGWCSGSGPWSVVDGDAGPAMVKGDAGQGINKQLPHMGNAGQGINKKPGESDSTQLILGWMRELSGRLRRVRVACGDFERVLSDSVLQLRGGGLDGMAGVLLDPPYPAGANEDDCYAGQDETASSVYGRAIAWATANACRPNLRIVVCGYEGLWTPPDGWTVRSWKNNAGYRREKGQRQEVLWCSPHCVRPVEDPQLGFGW